MNISALAQAAKSGSLIDFKRILRTSEDDVQRTDGDGWSPLHHAANNGHLSIVTILLEKGSDPALKTKRGETALDLAREGNHSDVIQILESRTEQTSSSSSINTSTTSTSGDLSPLLQPSSISNSTGAVKGPALKESSTPTEGPAANSNISPRSSIGVANSVKLFGQKIGGSTANASTTNADKAEIEKLRAELAALRKKVSEDDSRRLRGEKEKAAQENEAIAKLRAEANTLKASLSTAQAQLKKISADRDILQESLRTFEAADAGSQADQFKLGCNYEEGKEGVSQDASRAVEWYRRAAEKGHVNALNKMGICYMQGIGITSDKWEAVSWYRKAADSGHADAQYSLGSCYDDGIGVETDKLEAKSWYQKAANLGHKGALMSLR